jgi:hypothetical protein
MEGYARRREVPVDKKLKSTIPSGVANRRQTMTGSAVRPEEEGLGAGLAPETLGTPYRGWRAFKATFSRAQTRRGSGQGKLFRKYVLLMMAVVGGALLVSGGLQIYFSYEESKRSQLAIQQEKAIAAAWAIGEFVRQLRSQIAWTMQLALLPGAAGIEQRQLDLSAYCGRCQR